MLEHSYDGRISYTRENLTTSSKSVHYLNMARNHGHDKIFIIKIPSNLHTQQQCYAKVNFTTSIIYNVHEHTLTCDLKNFMTPLCKIYRRVPLKRCYIGFLDTIEIDVDAYQISFNCDIKISHFAVYLP